LLRISSELYPDTFMDMTYSDEEFRRTLRIIDASLNRIGEGLRFLEETARMILDDAGLTQKLKDLRHDIVVVEPYLHRQLVDARDSSGDVGADTQATGESGERNLEQLLVANSRRVQESLRTLEELAKLPDSPEEMDTDRYRQARFAVYEIEKELTGRITRKDRAERIKGLYLIIDMEILGDRSYMEIAEQAIKGGAAVIQLRDKIQGKKQTLAAARELRELCGKHGTLFIVNDHVDIAAASGADGAHLGRDDMPVEEARKILPIDRIIGSSTTSREQAVAAQAAGADYVAVGAIYPTGSKISTTTPAKEVGLDTLREVKQAVTAPVVAIGGINAENAADVKAAGADAAAVISAVLNAESPEEASRAISGIMKG
jgi:thiamine-phosphate pyrophosphorylase